MKDTRLELSKIDFWSDTHDRHIHFDSYGHDLFCPPVFDFLIITYTPKADAAHWLLLSTLI